MLVPFPFITFLDGWHQEQLPISKSTCLHTSQHTLNIGMLEAEIKSLH